MRWFSLFCLGLIATVGFTGCSGKGSNSPAPTKVSIPTTPDGTITAVAQSVGDGKFEAIWQAMPEKYQGGVKHQIEHFAEDMDKDVWGKSMGIVSKIAQLLETKQDLIIGNAKVSEMLTGLDIKPADAKEALAAIGGLLNDLSKDVKTTEALAKLNVESYLANIGSRFKKLEPVLAKSPAGQIMKFKLEDLKKVTAKIKDETTDTANVEVKGPDGTTEIWKMARVGGKWIPQVMADRWEKDLEEVHETMHGADMTPEQKKEFLAAADKVDGILDSLLKAKDQAAFDAAIKDAGDKAPAIMGGEKKMAVPPAN